MLSALLTTEGKAPITVNMPSLRQAGKTREQIRAHSWTCKFCGQHMTPRLGALRSWYFAHKQNASECPFNHESEPETPLHRALKHAAGEAVKAYFGSEVKSLEYEVRFPTVGRIADALITLKDTTRVAVEAQLSPLTIEHLQARTLAYLKEDVEVVWVFHENDPAGLKPGGLWDACRRWLLEEAFVVLTARSNVKETKIPLKELPL